MMRMKIARLMHYIFLLISVGLYVLYMWISQVKCLLLYPLFFHSNDFFKHSMLFLLSLSALFSINLHEIWVKMKNVFGAFFKFKNGKLYLTQIKTNMKDRKRHFGDDNKVAELNFNFFEELFSCVSRYCRWCFCSDVGEMCRWRKLTCTKSEKRKCRQFSNFHHFHPIISIRCSMISFSNSQHKKGKLELFSLFNNLDEFIFQ